MCKERQTIGTVLPEGPVCRNGKRKKARALMVVSGLILLAVGWWWRAEGFREEKVSLGDFDVGDTISIRIPKMPYVYALFTNPCPADMIDCMRSSNLNVDVYDNSGALVKREVIPGKFLLVWPVDSSQSPGGELMACRLYSLFADHRSIRLGKAYSVNIDIAMNNGCGPKRVGIHSISHW